MSRFPQVFLPRLALAVLGLAFLLAGLILPNSNKESAIPFPMDRKILLTREQSAVKIGELRGIAAGYDGAMLVSDAQGQLLRFSRVGEFVGAWGKGPAEVGGPIYGGVALDAAGVAYAVDTSSARVVKLLPDGSPAGEIDLVPYGPYGPNDVAVDGTGQVLVTDTGKNRVLVFNAAGKLVRTLGGEGDGAGQFRQTKGIAIDRNGQIVVGDMGNRRVQVLRQDGQPVLSIPLEASPSSVAVDARGRIFVAVGGAGIQVFDADGGALAKIGAGAEGRPPVGDARAVAISHSGGLLVIGGGQVTSVTLGESVVKPTEVPLAGRLALIAIGLLCGAVAWYWRFVCCLFRLATSAAQAILRRWRSATGRRQAEGTSDRAPRVDRRWLPRLQPWRGRPVARVGVLLGSLALAGTAQYIWSSQPPAISSTVTRLWRGLDAEYVATLPGLLVFMVAAIVFAYVVWDLLGGAPGEQLFESGEAGLEWRGSRLPVVLATFGLLLSCYVATTLWQKQYTAWHPWLFFASLALFTVAWLVSDRRRRVRVALRLSPLEWAYLGALALACWLLNVWDITSPHYSGIGDEYAFLAMAETILRGQAWNVFTQRGVYGLIPVLDSVYQAAAMWLLGDSVYGWKMSNVLVVLLTILPTYLLARSLFGSLVAAVSAAVLASSHYLLGYVRTGYVNLNPLPYTVFSLWLLMMALRYQSAALAFGSGVAAGLGFYTFYSSRVVILIVLAYLALGRQRVSLRRTIIPLIVGFFTTVAPMIATDKGYILEGMLQRSTMSNADAMSREPLAALVLENIYRSVLAFNFNQKGGPLTYGSLLDPLTAVPAALGLVCAVLALRDRRFRFLLIWYVAGIMTAGGLSQYTFVSVSRLHYLLPVMAIFAGVVVTACCRLLRGTLGEGYGRPLAVLFALIVPAIFVLNVYRFWYETPRYNPTTPDSLALELALSPMCNDAPRSPPVISSPNPEPNIKPAVLSYRLGDRTPILVAHRDLGRIAADASSPCFIFVDANRPEVQQAVREILRQSPAMALRSYTGPNKMWTVRYVSEQPLATDDGRFLLDDPRRSGPGWWLFALPVAVATVLFAAIASRGMPAFKEPSMRITAGVIPPDWRKQ